MINFFSKNRLGALIILLIFFNTAHTKCLGSTTILSSEIVFMENVLINDHPLFKVIQSLDGSIGDSWISLHNKNLAASCSQFLDFEASAGTDEYLAYASTRSNKETSYENSILWVLFINYFIVFFVSFIILYRTRVKQSKIRILHKATSCNYAEEQGS